MKQQQKLRVGVLFGGKSAEHEISLLSAKNVIAGLNLEKYEPVLIGIDKNGEWHLCDSTDFLMHAADPKLIALHSKKEKTTLVMQENQATLHNLVRGDSHPALDVIFPVLHGTFGEDGTVQGFLKLANLPFVGSSVLSSAACMDKEVMKRLLREAGIPIGKFVTITSFSKQNHSFESLVDQLGLPFFVKPASLGSSVGISKVKSKEEYESALTHALEFDHKVLVEEYIKGREIEVSVLGNEEPMCSLPGEVIPTHDFYSYEAKYLDDKGANFQIPVQLDPSRLETIQMLSLKAYRALYCEGMARVDFFLKDNGEVYVNELNTLPGFTSISMYPKLWEVSGLTFGDLLDTLLTLAIDRFKKEQHLKTRK